MTGKNLKIAHTLQAIDNLKSCLSVLKKDKANKAARKPYEDNLAAERAKLQKLLGK